MGIFTRNKDRERMDRERILVLENSNNYWMVQYERAHKELVRVNKACERLSRRCKGLRKKRQDEAC